MTHSGDSVFLRHIPCPECDSRNNAAVYTDGHEYCFGCGYYKHGSGETTPTEGRKRLAGLLREIDISPLGKRGITEETCRKFGYGIADYDDDRVQVAPYYDAEGNLVAQKIRTADKAMRWMGDAATALPFGAQAWQRTGRKIVVTEGEIDALSVSQVLGNTWPVVSIGCGAGPQLKKYIARHRDYLVAFDEVVLMFDMDEVGRAAAITAAEVIGTKARIAVLPLKDANDMLVEGRVKELVDAVWRAQKFQPDGIVDLASLKDKVLRPREWGLSYPWEEATKLTYGIRLGELIGFCGAAGFGKTEFFTEIAKHLVVDHEEKVGLFFLEQAVTETGKHLCGKVANKRFHLPKDVSGWTDEDLSCAWDTLSSRGSVFLYDSFGVNDWDSVSSRVRHLHHAEGVNYFFLDHLTALAMHTDDERKALDVIMSQLGSLVKELNVTVFFISHLSTPDGTPHEEGGHVALRHMRGSRGIAYWATFVFGGERDQVADDPIERSTALIRVLKDREGGNTGEKFYLRYNTDTGRLVSANAPPPTSHGFTKQARANTDF